MEASLGGSFKVGYEGEWTDSLPFDVSSEALKNATEAYVEFSQFKLKKALDSGLLRSTVILAPGNIGCR